MFKKDLYFVCNTNIFCIKIYFSNEIYIFYIFIYIFLCKKIFFSAKIFFNIKLFSHIKTFFSANNVFFVKNKYFFKNGIFFFNLVLQKTNNHIQQGYIQVFENIEIFKVKLKWSKSLRLLQGVAFLVSFKKKHKQQWN